MIALDDLAHDVGGEGALCPVGTGTRGGGCAGVRHVRAPAGIDWVQPDEMTVCCGAGTLVEELAAALADVGQRTVLPPGGTVGGALAHGVSSIRQLGDGPLRDALLQARYVSAAGQVVTAGGPTVKNVSGFDLCRLLVGSRGTLGVLGDVILRTRPCPQCSQWFGRVCDDPGPLLQTIYRPVAMLWDGAWIRVLLEGHPRDVEALATAHRLEPVEAPIVPSGARRSIRPSTAVELARTLPPGRFVVEVGVGAVHVDDPTMLAVDDPLPEGIVALHRRIRREFDPTGRLCPCGLTV